MIWQQCQGPTHIGRLSGTLYRLVESQTFATTTTMVDTLDEQDLLEQMLDETKPDYPDHAQTLHYLLKTPFRYPPLDWGSRYGQKHQPSLFYGGKDTATVLAESAYYRLVFWHSMQSPPYKNKIVTEHCLFNVDYHTEKGINLCVAPFDHYHPQLTHISDYSHTQTLGTDMRQADVDAFEYPSARSNGTCIALFTAQPFAQPKPQEMSQWLCELTQQQVSFKRIDENKLHKFPLAQFTSDNQLPMPA